MSTIDEAVYTQLAATSEITDYTGTDGIFQTVVDQEQDPPYVVFGATSAENTQTLAGVTTLWNTHIKVDCISDTYSECKNVAAGVRTALHGWTDAGGGGDPTVDSCRLVTESETFDNPVEGGEIGTWRIEQDYSIWYITT